MSRVIAAFSQFFDGTGEPLANGWLEFLVTNTNNTQKDTFADANQTIPNANPVQLDAEGRCPNVFGQGLYRVNLYENNPVVSGPGVLLQSFDPVVADYISEGAGGNFAEWDATIAYQVGQIVLYNNLYYRSFVANNLGNTPVVASSYWEQIDFLRFWNVNTTYAADDVVIEGTQIYFSLVGSNIGNQPSVTPAYWSPIASGTILLNWLESGTAFIPVVSGYNLGSSTNLIGNVYVGDSGILYLGDDQDALIYHNGTAMAILNTTGELSIGTQSASSLALVSSSVVQWRIDATGNLLPITNNNIGSATDLLENIYLSDTGILQLGADQDAKIYHDGSDLYIEETTGTMVFITGATNQWVIDASGDLLPLNSNAVGSATDLLSAVYLGDSSYLYLGAGQDGYLYHNGTNLYLVETTGSINIRTSTAAAIYFITDGFPRWSITSTGALLPSLGDKSIGNTSNLITDLYQEDAGSHFFGTDQDAYISHSGTEWDLYNATGDINIGTTSASGILFYTNSSLRWGVTSTGIIIPGGSNTYDIGTATFPLRSVYAATAPTTDYELCNKAYVDSVSGGSVTNAIINGRFRFWQRGTSSTSSGYLADRWYCGLSVSTGTFSQQAFTVGQTDVPGNPEYYLRVVNTTGGTAASYTLLQQPIEDVQTFSGETVTVSFYAKADASRNISTSFIQDFGTGGSSSITGIGATTHSLTTSWARYTVTVSVSSISGYTVGTGSNFRLRFFFDAGSDYDSQSNSLGTQSGTFEIANVQVELGSTANDFQRRSVQEEYYLCARFCQKSYGIQTALGTATSLGAVHWRAWTTNIRNGIRFEHRMRAIPTITIYSVSSGSSGYIYNQTTAADIPSTTYSIGETGFAVQQSSGTISLADQLRLHYLAEAEL